MTTDGPSPGDASRLYERHLDLLLAEEFACNDAFLTWFIGRCNLGGVPDVGTAQVHVVISHHGTEINIACGDCRQYVGTVTSFDPRQDLMSSVFSPNVRAVASERHGYRYPMYGIVTCSYGHTMDWSPQFFDPTVYYFENQATRGFQVARQQMTVRNSRAGRPGERPDRFPDEPAPHSSP